MLKAVLKTAKAYIGTQQGDGRHRDLIHKYNAVHPLPVGYPMKITDDWCAAFVTVVGDLTGASKHMGRECGVQRFVALFKQKGIWRGLQKPAAGDIVVFDWQKNGWADHIGFVETVEGNVITTIEGNTARQVARRSYLWNDWRIAGYARPKYLSADAPPPKSLPHLAQEVLQGKWGNGAERMSRLKKAGYEATAVQTEVNRLLQAKRPLKTTQTIAREVLQGKWGNGEERKKKLTEAGYNYLEVQTKVNSLL